VGVPRAQDAAQVAGLGRLQADDLGQAPEDLMTADQVVVQETQVSPVSISQGNAYVLDKDLVSIRGGILPGFPAALVNALVLPARAD
jgi:hypothetical protein